jgi:hypothetical protein
MYEYQKDEDGNYFLVRDQEDRHFIGGKVAIAFDKHDGVVLKHGRPELVNAWAEKTCKRAFKIMPELPESIVVLEGSFEIEELNKIISIVGYILRFFHKMNETGGIVNVFA